MLHYPWVRECRVRERVKRRGVMVMAAAEVTAPNTQTFLSSLTLFDVKPRHFLEHLCDPASES